MRKNALMLAFHFPPFAQSSGSIRTLSFVRHLPDHGWQPIVLTARENVYPEVDQRSLKMTPHRASILRAPGFDIARHLAIGGRYPTWLATPDRWNTWALAAIVAGLVCIRRHETAILWATFPIASALMAAMALHRLSKIPLIVDLRDPMVYEGWPEDTWLRATYSRIEKRVVTTASAIVVTTPSASGLYLERYPQVPASKFRIIANGVDDATSVQTSNSPRHREAPFFIVHSGLMEVPDRDPTAFFEAIARMLSQGHITDETLRVVLRATGRDEEYRRQIAALGVAHVVAVESRVPHEEAIEEMRRADGLLLFQGSQCNRQIPAKAYEYLACGRPIIGLIDPAGDTHELIVNQWKVPYVAAMHSVEAIANVLRRFIDDMGRGAAFIPDESLTEKHSRAAGARQLAALFDEVSGTAAHA
jgi:glycosyltransferase involved in cell wall biosynthesis